MYATIRKVAAWTLTGILTIAVFPIVSEIAINVAIEQGIISETPIADWGGKNGSYY